MKPRFKFHKWQLLLVALPLILLAIVAYQNAQRPQHLTGLGGAVIALAYSPEGDQIVCVTDNNYIQTWKADIKKWRSFQPVQRSSFGAPTSGFLHFSRDGKTLYGALLPEIFGSSGGSFGSFSNISPLQKWDAQSRRKIQGFRGLENSAFDISPDEHWAAATSYTGRLTLDMLDLTRAHKVDSKYALPPGERYFFRHHQTPMSQIPTVLAFAPSAPVLAVWDGSSEVELHSVPDGAMQKTLTFTTAPTTPAAPSRPGAPIYSSTSLPAALAWSPDGQWLAACNGTQLQIWDIEKNQTRSALLPAQIATPGMTGRTPILSWSHDGRQIATGGDNVCLWSVPDLTLQRQFRAQGGVAFSPDGHTLATGGFEGEHAVLLWPLKIWPF